MKPIYLKISGLNSFRESQEIDFERLSEAGIFGIFGPTGSGKSSILDAITLALYGKVERADNNTQAILNDSENRLNVEYTFALGVGSRRKKYRIERQYKKGNNNSVTAAQCRLLDITEPLETVLASSSTELTKKITEIIGMEFDDFTRAVVLPQGKFSQFLKLKGKERREMLERIFDLQEYGDRLNFKLASKLNAVEGEINGIIQFQMGLGDASQESINNAVANVKNVSEREFQTKNLLKDSQKLFDEEKNIWNLQQKKVIAHNKEQVFLLQQDAINVISEKLAKAERGEKLRPLLEEVAVLDQAIVAGKVEAYEARQLFEASEEQTKITDGLATVANANRMLNEPLLHTKIERLEQAKKLEEEIAKRAIKVNSLRDEYNVIKTKKDKLDQKLTALNANKNQQVEKLVLLKSRQQEITITPQRRKQIHDAAIALEAYNSVAKQVEELNNVLAKNEVELLHLQKQLHTDGSAQEILDKAMAERDALFNAVKELEQNSIAVILAENLANDQACPVCGSLEHPNLAKHVDNTQLEDLKTRLNKAGQHLKKTTELAPIYIGAQRLVQEGKNSLEKLQKELEIKKALLDEELPIIQKQVIAWDEEASKGAQSITELEIIIAKLELEFAELTSANTNLQLGLQEKKTVGIQEKAELDASTVKLKEITGEESAQKLYIKAKQELHDVVEQAEKSKLLAEEARKKLLDATQKHNTAKERLEFFAKSLSDKTALLVGGLLEAQFTTPQAARDALRSADARASMKKEIDTFNEGIALAKHEKAQISIELQGRSVTQEEWLACQEKLVLAQQAHNEVLQEMGAVQKMLEELKKNQQRWLETEEKRLKLAKLYDQYNLLSKTFRGKTFVEFIAEEQLRGVAIDASARLAKLTNNRYALELASDSTFIMRDDANGGYKRPVNTLSGGETFLTSLALALALSSQIQLRGETPLEFFFLDEGFGTLDLETLETVMNTLERLHVEDLTIGIISHVPELRNRIARRLIVKPAEPGGKGTTLKLEMA